MADVLMKCGCRASGTYKDKPICVVHSGLTPLAQEIAETPDLTGRMARCAYGCGSEQPSSLELAFFEYLGPGSPYGADTCKHCRMSQCAHERDPKRVDPSSVVERGQCPGFEAIGGREKDRYYCGCRGWD